MPVSFAGYTLPGTHVDNDPGHTTVHNQLLAALKVAAKVNVLDSAYGADPTGAADSTQAFINAIAAAGNTGIVYVPAGTYRCDTGKIPVATGLRLIGDGYESTTITCNFSGSNGYLFNLDPPGYSTSVHVEGMLITGLAITCTNADIFWGANLARCLIVDNKLTVSSNGFSVMNVSASTGTNGATYLAENVFRNVEMINGATRTVPAWNLDFSGSGLRCNDNVWEGRSGYKIWSSNAGDTSQYWFVCKGDAAGSKGSKNNTFRHLLFELPNGTGGLIHLLQMEGVHFDNCSLEDLAANTVGNPLILLNTIGGGAEGCQQVTFTNWFRRSGTNVSNTNPDVKLDANCDRVSFWHPKEASGGTGLTFDLQSATNVSIHTPKPSEVTVLNPGTGFHMTPAGPASFSPADPATTTSTTLVMMGLGSTCTYTPAGTGKVLAILTGQATTATASVAMVVGARFGTGTAPTNGAAVTGTTIGTDQTIRPGGTAGGVGFTITRVVSLTAGTAYWFDLAIDTSNAADAAKVTSVDVALVELP